MSSIRKTVRERELSSDIFRLSLRITPKTWRELKNIGIERKLEGHINVTVNHLIREAVSYWISKTRCGEAEPFEPSEPKESPQLPVMPDELYVTSRECYNQYPTACAPNSISIFFAKDKRFLDYCGKRIGRNYVVQPKKFIQYLAKFAGPLTRKRAIAILKCEAKG